MCYNKKQKYLEDGKSFPELKEKADYVTKTNNEGGIAYALENYLAK